MSAEERARWLANAISLYDALSARGMQGDEEAATMARVLLVEIAREKCALLHH